jgi:energy-coupling factor transporter transmembrane protein EcfT
VEVVEVRVEVDRVLEVVVLWAAALALVVLLIVVLVSVAATSIVVAIAVVVMVVTVALVVAKIAVVVVVAVVIVVDSGCIVLLVMVRTEGVVLFHASPSASSTKFENSKVSFVEQRQYPAPSQAWPV